MRLSDDYKTSFQEMIDKLKNSKIDPTTKLCAFWPMLGSQFIAGRGLLVIGRAVNGWQPAWTTDDIRNDNDIAASARRESEDPRTYCCPMGWVPALEGNAAEYNTRRSGFWRVIKRVAIDLHNGEKENEWACKIGWSNLAKISFMDGGNPSPSLWLAQEQSCLTLL